MPFFLGGGEESAAQTNNFTTIISATATGRALGATYGGSRTQETFENQFLKKLTEKRKWLFLAQHTISGAASFFLTDTFPSYIFLDQPDFRNGAPEVFRNQ